MTDNNRALTRREEDLKVFLVILHNLEKEYRVKVGGCGCCGSPYLYDEKTHIYYDDLNLETPKDD